MSILGRLFKSKYSDGVFLGWRVRKVLRKHNIVCQISQIKQKTSEVKKELDID